MSWAAAATVGGSLLNKSLGLGGGGGSSDAPLGPMDFTTNMGPTRFGDKYIGTDAIRAAPEIQTPGWVKGLAWGVGGLVALVALLLLLRRKKGQK